MDTRTRTQLLEVDPDLAAQQAEFDRIADVDIALDRLAAELAIDPDDLDEEGRTQRSRYERNELDEISPTHTSPAGSPDDTVSLVARRCPQCAGLGCLIVATPEQLVARGAEIRLGLAEPFDGGELPAAACDACGGSGWLPAPPPACAVCRGTGRLSYFNFLTGQSFVAACACAALRRPVLAALAAA